MKTPELKPDGIYPGVPAPEYFDGREGKAWAGRMSPSVLEHGVKGTMEHVKAAFDGELDPTESEALDFGKAYHARLLEPERFKVDFAIAQQCNAFTRDGKGPRCSKMGTAYIGGQWYCSTHNHADLDSERDVISEDEAATVEKMRAKVLAHNAIKMLRQGGQAEVCIAWTCPRTGIQSKTRLDKLIPDCDWGGEKVDTIVDLKSIRSANDREVEKVIEDRGYARAGAMRLDGYHTLTGRDAVYVLVFQEKAAPYAVSVKTLGPATMEGARREVRGLLAVWANCVKTGVYPGYSDDIEEIDVAAWKLREYQGQAQFAME